MSQKSQLTPLFKQTTFDCQFNWSRIDYLEITPQLYPHQTTSNGFEQDSKQTSTIQSLHAQSNRHSQRRRKLKIEQSQFEKDVKQYEEHSSTQTGPLQTEKTQEIKQKKIQKKPKKPKNSKKASDKQNFTKTLIGKIKEVIKRPKFLNLKRREKLTKLTELPKIYWYFFHQTIKNTVTLKILKQFLVQGAQFTLLEQFKQQIKDQKGQQMDMSFQTIDTLRRQLRQKIIQNDLLELAKTKGQMKQTKKQVFISQLEQFIEDLKVGKVKPQHK